MSSPHQLQVTNWVQWSMTEQALCRALEKDLEAHIALAQTLDPQPFASVRRLGHALDRQRAWAAAGTGPTITFLTAAVEGGAGLATALASAHKYGAAFTIGNSYLELCKVLVAYHRQKHGPLFKRLLMNVLLAISASQLEDTSAELLASDLASLRRQLEDLVWNKILKTAFSERHKLFRPEARPDRVLGEGAINEVLGQHFDRRLRHLLEYERPRVKEYAMVNMPIAYQLPLAGEWLAKRQEWKSLMATAGYEDVIRLLSEMGDLLSVQEIGSFSDERKADIRRAVAANDLARVRDLLKDSASEIRAFLYLEAQKRLDYRPPRFPNLPEGDARRRFLQIEALARTGDPADISKALAEAKVVWRDQIANLEVRDWVGYLEARAVNLAGAEQMFRYVRRQREAKDNQTTDWNLAVLANERKDEAAAYELLRPLARQGAGDESLILVLMALALRQDDRETFLGLVPQALSIRYHPLAILVAHDSGKEARETELIVELLKQLETRWELPPPEHVFNRTADLENTVNQAIVEGQVDQVIAWLEKRIGLNHNERHNYLALARVWEQEKVTADHVDHAFRTLARRVEVVRRQRPRDQRKVDEACRELLTLARRNDRADLGGRAYEAATKSYAHQDLLESFRSYAPAEGEEAASEPLPPPLPPQPPPPLPPASNRLAWIVAQLAQVRNVAAYAKETQVIADFVGHLADLSPSESGVVAELINNSTSVITSFERSRPDDLDGRRLLHDRLSGYQARLSQLIAGDGLPKLAQVVAAYNVALKQVLGDVTRQVGIGPSIVASVVNHFVSLESERTTLAVRLENRSVKPVTRVQAELMLEESVLKIQGDRNRRVDTMDAGETTLLVFPLERTALPGATEKEMHVSVSLNASAEGFPNIDLGVSRHAIPLQSMREAIGVQRIPVLFQNDAIRASDPALFQGRDDVLLKIQGSFHGNAQRERYFLDGIRRVGKTTLLNFLPQHLPDWVLPVSINLEDFDFRGEIDSADVLRRFCSHVRDAATGRGVEIDAPDSAAFARDPGEAFGDYLRLARAALGDRIPLLMVDELQKLLVAVARGTSGRDVDSLVLDQLRVKMDEGRLFAIFTGSTRYDRLAEILQHRIYGSFHRLRVSFLSHESVGQVLRAGLGEWCELPGETVARIHQLTGGYPWLVQAYGAELVDLLNREMRAVATPPDVDVVTQSAILGSPEKFAHWWPSDQLGQDEERFVELLFRRYGTQPAVSTPVFFGEIHNREQAAFRRALENLKACEVLDSNRSDVLRFSGDVLRQWLELQVQDGKLRIRKDSGGAAVDKGQSAIFIDHENLIKALERASIARGVSIPGERRAWFGRALDRLLDEAERRVGHVDHHVMVAFLDYPSVSEILPSYTKHEFDLRAPQDVKKENAVDFKLVLEVQKVREDAIKEGSSLQRAIVICGDGDLSHTVAALKNEGVKVQVWGGSESTNGIYWKIVGEDNVVALDDLAGF